MHRYAEPKHFLERLVFRAPPAGTGPIAFRALIKQGDTNMGAFYWPSAPSSGGSSTLAPGVGRTSGGDLVLVEDLTPPTRAWSYRGQPGESCTTVCESRGLECDGDKLLEATSATALATSVDTSFLCAPPYLSTCSEAAPHMSGLGDGLCFYRNDDTCPTRAGGAAASCDAPSSTSIDDGLRLCVQAEDRLIHCRPPARRRRQHDRRRAVRSAGGACALSVVAVGPLGGPRRRRRPEPLPQTGPSPPGAPRRPRPTPAVPTP